MLTEKKKTFQQNTEKNSLRTTRNTQSVKQVAPRVAFFSVQRLSCKEFFVEDDDSYIKDKRD